jgi:hypothetical protein
MPNKSCKQIYIEILKCKKYSMHMILLHDTNQYRDSIIHRYHMYDTTTWYLTLWPALENLKDYTSRKHGLCLELLGALAPVMLRTQTKGCIITGSSSHGFSTGSCHEQVLKGWRQPTGVKSFFAPHAPPVDRLF